MSRSGGVWSLWQTDGLRTRFRPRSRIGQALFSVSPWLDVLLIGLLFLGTNRLLLLQPGIAFDLPRAPFREGMRSGMTAVVLRVDRPSGAESLVFFDDERFLPELPEHLDALRQLLSVRVRQHGQRELLLHTDRGVPHGDVMRLVNVAREAGIARVNVSLKPE